MDGVIPSPYEWAGGFEAIQALFKAFYTRVPLDPVLGPVFAGMPAERLSRRACAETRRGVLLHSIHGPRDE
jgi:truncated hemoglobin YjbI